MKFYGQFPGGMHRRSPMLLKILEEFLGQTIRDFFKKAQAARVVNRGGERCHGNLSWRSIHFFLLVLSQFNSREDPRFTKSHVDAILHMKGVTIMREMRSLIDALLLLSLIVVVGAVLGIVFGY